MDWEKVDLTIEGHIGDDEHPNKPWHLRRRHMESDLYIDLFRRDRDGVLRIVDDYDLRSASGYCEFFGSYPKYLIDEQPWMNCTSAGGDKCDRCSVTINLLNSSNPLCCDKCDKEMLEEMAANPNVVFAFESGGLRAVA